MPAFEPCPCCKDSPQHAFQTWRDSGSGDVFRVQLPWEARHTSIGWKRWVRWKDKDGQTRHGNLEAEGPDGVAALDDQGNVHRLHAGTFEDVDDDGPVRRIPRMTLRGLAPVRVQPLAKGGDLKPGQRWITVHPHGPGTEGQAVLIQPAGDGSYRVIAGAGGALTHLRLKNVGEPGAKKDPKEKKKRGPGAATEEGKASRAELDKKKRDAERQFVERVRSRHGGVSEDLDEEKLGGLSTGARNLLVSRHHAKQVREAREMAHSIARKLAEQDAEVARADAGLSAAMEDQPNLVDKAREVAALELELVEQEQKERRGERAERASRVTSGETRVGEKAAAAVEETIRKAPDPEHVIAAIEASPEPSASDLKELEAQRSLQKAKAALENGDVETAAAALRRHEVQVAQAEAYAEIEAEAGPEAAHNALAFSRVLSNIAQEAGTASRLGLTDTEHVPVKGSELGDMMETLADAERLRKVKREFKAAVKAVENGEYDRSRRAFDLDATDATTEEAMRAVRDATQRQLTELLVGLADTKRPAHVQSVAVGHYDAMADVALGLADQRFVDRPTVDAIGLRNSAMLLRHALEGAGFDTKAMAEAVTEHHVANLDRITSEAIARADKAIPHLSTVVEDVGSLEQAMSHIQAAEADLDDAQRAVGSALGRMEFTATMGQALRDRLPDAMTVQAGDSIDGTLQWLHSVGLTPGDYQIGKDRKAVSIPKASWRKLISPVSKEEMETRSAVRGIKRGDADEAGWLPAGIKRREASTFTAPAPAAPRFFEPLKTGGDLRANLENHVGRRVAEGEHPADIMRDMLSPQVLDSVPNRDAFIEHVKAVFPLVGDDGKAKKYEESAAHFEALAEKAVGDRAYHAQDIRPDDEKTREAAFRALAEHPRARVAFKAVGELTPQDQGVLRDHFYDRMKIDPKVRIDEARYRAELADLGPEPSKTAGTMSLFGDSGPTAEWKEWKRDRDALLARHPRAGLADALADLGPAPPENTPARAAYDARADALREAAVNAPTAWGRYVLAHGSLEAAQAAMQDEIRSGFVKTFADHYGKITGRSLRTGITEVRNSERHVAAVASPEEREELIRQAQRTYAALRARAGGKFAAEGEGAVIGKFTEWLEQSTIAEQNQGGLFASTPAMRHTRGEATPKTGQRYSVGRRAEEQLQSVVGNLGTGFKNDRVDLVRGLAMDGDQIAQQRVIKMLQKTRRVGAYLGTGSGKSLTSIGAYTDAHARGETQHGLYLVPAAVQQQFGSEVLRFTEPGKYRWATGEGKSHDERVAMLRDPSVHMRVLTHESFRDTAMKVMADHHGRTEAQMEADLRGADTKTRAQWMREAFDAAGIPQHFVYGDEWHRVTHREGEPSALHLVGAAVSHPTNATHFLAGTATPHKNDASEVHSMAAMLDPDKYGDRHAFMQSFGHDIEHNPNAVRRELDHLTYSAHITPAGVERQDNDQEVKLTGDHARHVERVGDLYEQARRGLRRGVVDVAAIRELSPSAFAGRPEAEHEAIAARLGKSLGIVRESAMRRAINAAPPEFNQKLKALGDHVANDVANGEWTDRRGNKQRGKPSIVFTDRLGEAKMIHEHLRARGIRAALYHGGLGTSEREAIRRGFQPSGGGAAEHDVIVATSAAEAGINLQRARVVHHYDVPETEKSHTQRSGRAYRQGAEGDVEIHNWHTDTEYERNARARLSRKAALGEVFRSNLPTHDERGIASAYAAAISRRHQAQEVA